MLILFEPPFAEIPIMLRLLAAIAAPRYWTSLNIRHVRRTRQSPGRSGARAACAVCGRGPRSTTVTLLACCYGRLHACRRATGIRHYLRHHRIPDAGLERAEDAERRSRVRKVTLPFRPLTRRRYANYFKPLPQRQASNVAACWGRAMKAAVRRFRSSVG